MGFDGTRPEQADDRERPVVVFGAAGQLGEAMARACQQHGPTIAATRDLLDLTDGVRVRRFIESTRPAAIINCAGYNNVDGAEADPIAALSANAISVRTLSRAARDVGAVLVHYSSDFVFDGETDRPYREDSRPNPRSVYAASKLLSEWFAAEVPVHYVLRLESLFGGVSRRKSSLDQIIERVAAGVPVRVFTDRVVSPSYVWDIVEATLAVLRSRPEPGIYHCVNSGHATWHDIAIEVARLLDVPATLEPITLADVALAAERPRYCALANDKLRAAGISLPTWQDALARAITARAAELSQH